MPAIGAAVGAVAGLFGTTAGGLVARIAIGVGLSFLSRALAPKPKDASATTNSPTGTSADVQMGAEVPRTIPFGNVKNPGHFIYFNSYGTSNKSLQLVYVLGDWYLEGLTSVYVDGKACALTSIATTANEDKRYSVANFTANITVAFYKGSPTQTVCPDLVSFANPAGRWASANTLAGMSYVVVTLTYDPKIFDNIPSFEWVIQGAKLYDWRKDSTNGGSGSHRWATPSTWEYSQNPAVIRYNFQKGFFITGQRVLGMSLTDADLLLPLYTSAANICDEVVTNPNSTTQARYQCNLIIRDDQRYGDVLAAIDLCMASLSVERQGAFAPIAGAGYTPVDTFTDADLVADEDFEFQAKRTREELLNAVFGQFVNPSAHWEMDSYPPIISTSLETTDGERLAADGQDFPGTIDHWHAQRLARIILNLTRLQGRLSCALGFHKLWYQVGDWVTYNSATALYSRTYRVEGKKVDAFNKRVYIVLQEISSAAYGDNVLTDISPTITDTTPTRATTVSGFTIQAATITATDGRVLPALKFNWTLPDDSTIDSVVIEYRKVGTLVSFVATENTPEGGQHVTAANVVGGTNYEARATIITTPARSVTFTGYVSIPTSSEVMSLAVLDAQTRHAISLVVDDIPGSMTQRFADSNTLVQTLSSTVATDRANFTTADQQIRTDFGAADAVNAAAVVTEKNARISADSAQVTSINGLLATTATNTAAIASEQTARTSADTANANSISTVQASLATKPNTYSQSSAPGAPHIIGDIWIRQPDGAIFRWDGSTFVQQPSAASGNKTYAQPSAPAPPLNAGDIWYDTDDSNRGWRWNGSAFAEIRDALIALNTAAIANETSARVTAVGAVSQQAIQALAQSGDATASGFIRLRASAAPAGVTSQFEIQLNTGTVNTPNYVSCGLYMQIVGGVGRIFLDTTVFAVGQLDIAGILPFLVSGNQVFIQNAAIKSLTVANMVNGGLSELIIGRQTKKIAFANALTVKNVVNTPVLTFPGRGRFSIQAAYNGVIKKPGTAGSVNTCSATLYAVRNGVIQALFSSVSNFDYGLNAPANITVTPSLIGAYDPPNSVADIYFLLRGKGANSSITGALITATWHKD